MRVWLWIKANPWAVTLLCVAALGLSMWRAS